MIKEQPHRYWTLEEGQSPIIADCVHNGHALLPGRETSLGIDEATRLREEDPYTAAWTVVTDNRLVVDLSRFEVDMNRPRNRAIYLTEQDAWGLCSWKRPPNEREIGERLEFYDLFYADLKGLIEKTIAKHGKVVVLDIHSYNHRRQGPEAPPEDPARNPEINIGTGSMPRDQWGLLVDRFIDDLRNFDFEGRHLDVRENIRFYGANIPTWIHTHYPGQACALAIEAKKIFMDEWSGQLFEHEHQLILKALQSTIPGLLESLSTI